MKQDDGYSFYADQSIEPVGNGLLSLFSYHSFQAQG